jgi:phage tail-like protein
MPRRDPYVAHRFLVEIGAEVVASFSECSGLALETEFEEVQEGGENQVRYKLPKGAKWSNLTLKHGLTDSRALWDWYRSRMQGDFTSAGGKRRSIAVILWDESLADQVWRWDFAAAYPVKWTGPELKADAAAVAVETLEFAHHGLAGGGPR